MELPMYFISVDEDGEKGLLKTSLVEEPATKTYYQAFKTEQPYVFSEEGEQRIVTGPAIITDTPIYRTNPHPCYVVFTKDNTAKMVKKYAKMGFGAVSLDHESDTDGVYLLESWFKDDTKGKPSPKGFDVPDGSYFQSFLVENDEVWKGVKEGKFKGFSMEGIFNLSQMSFADEFSKEADKVVEMIRNFAPLA